MSSGWLNGISVKGLEIVLKISAKDPGSCFFFFFFNHPLYLRGTQRGGRSALLAKVRVSWGTRLGGGSVGRDPHCVIVCSQETLSPLESWN